MSVSQSQIKTMRRCGRKHHYKYVQGLSRKIRAQPLLRGTILHEMIEAGVTGNDPMKVYRESKKKYEKLFREQREEYGETFMEDLLRVFQGWARATHQDKLKYEFIEKKGEVELPNGLGFKYIVDAIAVDENKRRWLIDRKTHKSIPDEKKRAADVQTVLYYWAWNLEHPKQPVDGVMWDYLRTKPPAIPEQLKSGELSQRQNIDTDYYTYSSEVLRLKLDPKPYKALLDKLKARGHVDFFQRITLPAPPKELLLSLVTDASITARYIIDHGKDDTTRNLTHNCCFDCEFFQLCQAELRGLDSKFVRAQQYEERDPDERYKDEEEE